MTNQTHESFSLSIFFRKLDLLIGLLSLLGFASSDKSIDCTYSVTDWFYFDRSFRTCQLKNQAIDSVDFTITSSVDSTVEGIDTTNNLKVEFLPENLSEKFPGLIGASFWICSIQSIDEHHFKGLHKLIFIQLGSNKIERIDNNAFKDNSKLERLGLGYNNIQYLSSDLFNSLRNLKQLYLQNNQIRFIDPFQFKQLASLEEIHMSNNKIRFLHPETFATLSNLRLLLMSNNQLESIDGRLLANNKKVERLWFENNKLRSIDAETFDDKEILWFVDLEGNNCIDGYFNLSSFTSMKTAIKEKCAPSIESLKRDLSILDRGKSASVVERISAME
jgi:Leucine-rich repeat (LRR) protein